MYYHYPNNQGYFGPYGGRIVPPELEKELALLAKTYQEARKDKVFQCALALELKHFVNRPSPLYRATRLFKRTDVQIYLKREDLNHTGAHKINNAVGQGLLARRMGKKVIIAETGAGQHGVAAATVAARYGMKCKVFMGERDIVNQRVNVDRIKLLGAEVIPVTAGQQTLKDAVDAALTAYVKDPQAYYLLGSAVGPHPYPVMVRDFQKIIGLEAKRQLKRITGKLPNIVVACVGGGSNALGIFSAFIRNQSVSLIAVEPAGLGQATGKHGLSLALGKLGEIHGYKSLVLKQPNGTIAESYSAASGLDYPGVAPELSLLKDMGRLQLESVTDNEARQAFVDLSRSEGIIPALESAHAIAYIKREIDNFKPGTICLVNLSGRGDKDVDAVGKTLQSIPNARVRYNTNRQTKKE